jgi:peptidoglycan/xylan/chitin deacetylase (PgdA/CDA1 family)
MSGTLTISVEVELGWGVHDLGTDDHLSEDCRHERAHLTRLLDACDEFDVPVSFDVVGHLLLDACAGHDATGYPPGWFDADPETGVEEHPAFYAPETVAAIRARPTDHEVCTHTFSHVLCGEVDPDVVDRELRRCRALHEDRLGEPPVSLVPPRHSPPPARVLRENGVEVVRLARDTRGPTPAHRYAELLAGRPPLHEPRLVDGVVETYCTDYPSLAAPALPAGRRDTHWSFRALPTALRRRLHVRRLAGATRAAADRDATLHLWPHLYDLSNEPQTRAVRSFLARAARIRDERGLSIRTMADLNRAVRAEAGRAGATA